MKDIKKMLLEAPDSQLDSSMKPLIEKWSEVPTALEILEVVDQVVYSSLGSGFTVQLLHFLLNDALGREQTSLDELAQKATWRNK